MCTYQATQWFTLVACVAMLQALSLVLHTFTPLTLLAHEHAYFLQDNGDSTS